VEKDDESGRRKKTSDRAEQLWPALRLVSTYRVLFHATTTTIIIKNTTSTTIINIDKFTTSTMAIVINNSATITTTPPPPPLPPHHHHHHYHHTTTTTTTTTIFIAAKNSSPRANTNIHFSLLDSVSRKHFGLRLPSTYLAIISRPRRLYAGCHFTPTMCSESPTHSFLSLYESTFEIPRYIPCFIFSVMCTICLISAHVSAGSVYYHSCHFTCF
jgi:hypothetical protein